MLPLEKQFHLQTLLTEVNRLNNLEQAKEMLRKLVHHCMVYEQQVADIIKTKLEGDWQQAITKPDDEEHSY